MGQLSMSQALQATIQEKGEIPNPTYGYLRGSLTEHRKIDESMANALIGRDLYKMIYVGETRKV